MITLAVVAVVAVEVAKRNTAGRVRMCGGRRGT